ncbi:MAG: hypothetical protein IT271_05040 [Chitinophagales bacterium]|nr:hypothetical protein [Chitinophagales bacterium]
MKNYNIILLSVLILSVLVSCKKDFEPSKPVVVSLPYVAEYYVDETYVIGIGSGVSIYQSIPDTVALVVDSLAGFSNGFGGRTGKDSAYVLKSDIVSWPDTTKSGGYTLKFEKFNSNNYLVSIPSNIVLASPIENPGPTDLEGTYTRTANGYVIEISKISDGVYLIDNPGGAGVALQPYLLYNYSNSLGQDSLAFAAQLNPCGSFTKLVSPLAPMNLTVGEYDEAYPPAIISTSPVTLQWKIFEFADNSSDFSHNGNALCQWGTGVRTFIKD